MHPIDQSTILVTGATDGLGRAVAERLAGAGATVMLHGRDAGRLAAAREQIAAATGSETLSTHRADLASLAEVRALAADVERSAGALHVLVNNAGVGAGMPTGTERMESRDGYELRFAVNHLAGFALTLHLLGLLRRSAPARVVNVASLGQAPVDFDDVMLERDYRGQQAYAQSKLAQIACGAELAARVPAGEVTVNSLHPGTYMPTKMVVEEIGRTVDTLETGVESTLRLIADPALDGVSGRFFDRGEESAPHAQAADPAARLRLWELSLELTGAPAPDVS